MALVLTNTAKLPSLEVELIYTSTSNVGNDSPHPSNIGYSETSYRPNAALLGFGSFARELTEQRKAVYLLGYQFIQRILKGAKE